MKPPVHITLLCLVCVFDAIWAFPNRHPCKDLPECSCSVIIYPDVEVDVDCAGKSLTSVPENIPRNTVILDLSRNPLGVLRNHSFRGLFKLTELKADDANLKFIDVGAFSDLKSLEFLSLLNNDELGFYEAKLEENVFAPLQKLTELRVYGNVASFSKTLKYPDYLLTTLKNIESLQIDGLPAAAFGDSMKYLVNLTSLYMSGIHGNSYCNMTNIPQNYFYNIPYIKKLTIQKCGVVNIHKLALGALKNIFKLDLSYNMDLNLHGFEEASYSLRNSSITELYLIAIHRTFGLGVPVKRSHVQWMKNTPLQKWDVSSNRLEIIEDGTLLDLPPGLQLVNIADNKLTYGIYFLETALLTNVIYVNMSLMFTSHSPLTGSTDTRLTCSGDSDSIARGHNPETLHVIGESRADEFINNKQQTINETGSMLTDGFHLKKTLLPVLAAGIPMPKSVKRILAFQMSLHYEIPRIIFQKNNLELLDLSSNLLYSWVGPVIGFEKVRFVNLSNNFCSHISDHFFDEMVGIQSLILDNNLLGFEISDDRRGNIFKNLVNIRVLNLVQNRLTDVPDKLLVHMRNLSHLDLSRNILSDLDFSIDSLTSLSYLDLSHNVIPYIPAEMRNAFDKLGSRLTLIITGNKLQCNCETIEFLEWIQTTDVKVPSKEQLHCKVDGKRIYFTDIESVIKQLDQRCRDYVPFILVGVTCVCLYIVGILLMVIYRYRWKLRYLYYVGRARFHQAEHEGEFLYDAFISYAEEDKPFINEMSERLENNSRLNLCIHERNFVAGMPIEYNITACIHNSRKVVCILSSSFFKRPWCKYEFHTARVEEMHTGRDVLILVNLSYFLSKEIPHEIKEQMEFASYITYPNCPDERIRELFWANLIMSILDSA